MFRIILVVTLSGMLAGIGQARAACPISDTNPDEEVHPAELEAKLTPSDIGVDALGSVLFRGRRPDQVAVKGVWKLRGNKHLVAWSQCIDDYACTAHASIVKQRRGKVSRVARTLLPYWWDAGEEITDVTVRRVGITDVDGVGGDEVVIEYDVDEPERADGTRKTHIVVGIFSLESLALKWIWETAWSDTRTGQRCSGSIMRRDVNCDRLTDIVIEKACEIKQVEDAAKLNKTAFKYIKGPGYWLAFGEEETLQPIEDKRPWAVVAGNIPVASSDYEDRAKRLLKKVHEAGFKDAEIFNSRRYRAMKCCFRTVIADRFADKVAAEKLRDEMRKKKLQAYVRKAF